MFHFGGESNKFTCCMRRLPSSVPRWFPFISLWHPLCTVQRDPQFFAALVCPGEMRMPGMQLPLLLAQPGEPGEPRVGQDYGSNLSGGKWNSRATKATPGKYFIWCDSTQFSVVGSATDDCCVRLISSEVTWIIVVALRKWFALNLNKIECE